MRFKVTFEEKTKYNKMARSVEVRAMTKKDAERVFQSMYKPSKYKMLETVQIPIEDK